jgi:hypothetical protein
MSSLTANARSLRDLGKRLRKQQPLVAASVRKSLRVSGQVIADTAKDNASWSSTIPDSIKVRASGPASVTISAGGKAAPSAKAYEEGRKAYSSNGGGSFNHPVFAHGPRSSWTWVSEDTRPYLRPAALSHLLETREAIRDGIQTVVDAAVEGI